MTIAHYVLQSFSPFFSCRSYLFSELIESAMYLFQATKDPYFLEIGRDMLESIEKSAKTPCGYATVSTYYKLVSATTQLSDPET